MSGSSGETLRRHRPLHRRDGGAGRCWPNADRRRHGGGRRPVGVPGLVGAPPVERSAALTRLAALLDERSGDLARTESRQTGKPIRLATGFDVPGTVDNVAFFAGAARALEGKSAGEYSGDHTSYVRREAIGVVGSVAPWNYPLQMAAWKILPAVAAGNTIVLKPAELTPLTALMLAEAAHRGGPARRRGQRRHRHRQGRRRGPDVPPRRGHGLVHRLVGSRPPGDGARRSVEARPEAGPPRARRQGPVPRLRRRRPRGHGAGGRRRLH